MDSKSYLVSGGTKDQRIKEVFKLISTYNPEICELTQRPDFFILEDESSLGIDAVRELQKKISLKAWGEFPKISLIKDAQGLTLEAQNAFLKTLEEPPASTIIILETPQLDLLLPTILSRCLQINLNREVESELLDAGLVTKALSDFLFLKTAKIGEKFEFAQGLTSQKLSRDWLVSQTILWRDLLLASLGCTKHFLTVIDPGSFYTYDPVKHLDVMLIKNFIVRLETAKKDLEANINERLVMENLLLEMPAV